MCGAGAQCKGNQQPRLLLGTPAVVSPLPRAIVTGLEVQLCHHICLQVCGFSVTLVFSKDRAWVSSV